MKVLETEIDIKTLGTRLRGTAIQVIRDGDVAIYKLGEKNFEVIIIHKQKAHTAVIKGVKYTFEEAEKYPKEYYWGERGWTYTTLEEAFVKFHKITENRKHRV